MVVKKQPFSIQEFKKNILALTELAQNNQVLFIHQAYLDKASSEFEKRLLDSQKKHLVRADFYKNREEISYHIQTIPSISYIDLQDYFSRRKEEYFTDLCHLNPKANQTVSQLIQERLHKK